ncbi:MAG: hypothetical protein IJ115_04705 [Erysipelotrichaceae bacterium]|nr:hypothetical protein [Erysipelotrichaceae bacterium]
MRNIYLNNLVDITDPNCEFIEEFDNEIRRYGALVYNHEYNSYQFIKQFNHIDYKKELLPDFIRVENSNPLLKALTITVHYEFDPETEEDEENLEIWQQLKEIDLPVFDYDDDGEIYLSKEVKLYPSESKHTIWFLNRDSYEYIADQDLLMISPVIKNIQIARKLIKDFGVHPFENVFDPNDDIGYVDPDLVGILNGKKKSN